MPTGRYNVSEAAALVGISPSSMRNWCTQFGAHLSAGASPGPGVERVLNDNDIAILQQIQQWRREHRPYEQIAGLLADLDTEALQPYIELPATEEAPQEDQAPTEPPQSPTEALTLAATFVHALDNHTAPLQARIEKLETAHESATMIFLFGFACGILTAAIAVLAFFIGAG